MFGSGKSKMRRMVKFGARRASKRSENLGAFAKQGAQTVVAPPTTWPSYNSFVTKFTWSTEEHGAKRENLLSVSCSLSLTTVGRSGWTGACCSQPNSSQGRARRVSCARRKLRTQLYHVSLPGPMTKVANNNATNRPS